MMDGSEELTDEQLQRMAEQLLAGWKPASALTGLDPTELRMAQNLLGRSNTERLAHSGSGRRFKYRRPVHEIEYYRAAWGWQVDLLENGMRQTFKASLSDADLGTVLAAIRAKGIPVRRFETEGERLNRIARERRLETNPTVKVRLKSERFDILDELRDFHL
ncbi:hypothetical protein [Mesorhizobium sp. M8A.F.Ca.ET.165.01.1.1]|uniref:hypothetical protein n=1 Tax=Mesorhizobium sp. M8A.F.Ca.ET.165.01.1.1 TaxID=2563960 RepID=UPI001093D4CE|nr:hypothetical protein [Mesorhizobium sp. M8A.F.Ca.ET.165.01.1.1]TGT42832.1 hypothetical protein EN808_13215 [Mesorhizobium sp. M8A.F.Ca.ET.165.01.1.1]